MAQKRSLTQTNPVPARKRLRIRVPRHKKRSQINIHGPLDQTTRHNVQQQQRRPISKPPPLSPQQRAVSSTRQLSRRSPLPTTNNQRPAPNKQSLSISAPKPRTRRPQNTSSRSPPNVQSHAHSTNRNVVHQSHSPTTHRVQHSAPNTLSAVVSTARPRAVPSPNASHRLPSNGQSHRDSHGHSSNRNVNSHSHSRTTQSAQPQRQRHVPASSQTIPPRMPPSRRPPQIPNEPSSTTAVPSTSNVSQSHHERVHVHSVSPLQRKAPRKLKPIDSKISYIFKAVRQQIGNRTLSGMVILDHIGLKWWYCDSCDIVEGITNKRKCVRVRSIVDHLRSQSHHKKLKDDLKKIDTKRREKEAAEQRQKLKAQEQLMALNRTRSELIMEQEEASKVHNDMDGKVVFHFNDSNEWHQQIKIALTHCNLNHNLSMKQMRAINYFHTVHSAVIKMSSVSAIQDRLKSELQHSAVTPGHYIGASDITDAVHALAAAQRDIDMKLIAKHQEVSISEDGNKLHGMPGRGYMVKVIERFKMMEIFCDLKDPSKDPSMSWDDLESIDTGKDTFSAMKKFVTNDLKKKCTDIASIATDWSGTNSGHNKGARGYV